MTAAVAGVDRRLTTADPTGLVWAGPVDVPAGWGPCVVTIGVFDGVHRGHARLIRRTVERARELGLPAVMITFDRHPATVAGPARDTSTLSTPQRRAELAGAHGIDAVLILPFTPQLARTSAADFVRQILLERLHARAVVVGDGFRFGAAGRGDLDVLRRLGRRHGFTAERVDLLHDADVRCSSTHIRRCLITGDIDAATTALGRPHRIHGRLDGRSLTVPPGTALPLPGRYLGTVIAGRAGHPVGVTVADGLMVTLDGPPADLHGAVVDVDFLARSG